MRCISYMLMRSDVAMDNFTNDAVKQAPSSVYVVAPYVV